MGKRKKGKGKGKEELYQVEVILGARVSEDSEWEYLVKWAGYSSDENSWEPAVNVKDCERLLVSFWTNIGHDERDYHVGDEVRPTQGWIDAEVAYLKRELEGELEEEGETRKKSKANQKSRVKRTGTFGMKIKLSPSKLHGLDTRPPSDEFPSPSTQLRTTEELSAQSLAQQLFPDDEERSPSPSRSVSPDSLFSVEPSPSPERTIHNSPQGNPLPAPATTAPVALVPRMPVLEPASSKAITGHSPNIASQVPGAQLQISNPSSEITSKLPTHEGGHSAKVTPISGPLTKAAPGSSLATKHRLGQIGLELVTPTSKPALAPIATTSNAKSSVPPSRVNPRPLPSFKKITKSTEGQQHANILSPKTPPAVALPRNEVTALPIPEYDVVSPQDFDPFLIDRDEDINMDNMDPSSILPHDVSGPTTAAAEQFLSAIMPAELAAPLEYVPTSQYPPYPLSSFLRASHEAMDGAPVLRPMAKPLPVKRIPKKWKWKGDLFADVANDTAERICDVILSDNTDHLAEGLRLNIIFDSMNSLRLKELLPLATVDVVLRACTPVHQLARLTTQDGPDAERLKAISEIMAQRQQVAVADIYFQSVAVGILLVFPSSFDTLCTRFQVPQDLRQTGSMVVALFGWSPPINSNREYEWRRPLSEVKHESVRLPSLDGIFLERTIRNKSTYNHAMQILRFPDWLHDAMSLPNRPYCVWWETADSTPSEKGLETTLLHSILDHCGAQDVGYKADVRAVFVHVGALESLCWLTALAERRSKRFEVRFFTYGTHQSIHPERWGVREIYPLGGVITFCPSALVEDPVGARSLIMQAAAHPLWTCYLLPSVVGMLAKLTCRDKDPLALFDQGEFFDDYLLMLVEEGQLSLLRAPPRSLGADDAARDWVLSQYMLLPKQTRGLLEACMQEFTERYLTVKESAWASTIETEISEDLLSMQLQPAMMDSYRRFVAIKGSKDDHIRWDKDGLEWVTISGFNFKDDFFAAVEDKNS